MVLIELALVVIYTCVLVIKTCSSEQCNSNLVQHVPVQLIAFAPLLRSFFGRVQNLRAWRRCQR